MNPDLKRREFIKMAVTGTGATVAAGMLDSPSQAAEVHGIPKWDLEADVVIVGYGGSGASAAIAAADAKAKVLVLEKSPFAGGGTIATDAAPQQTLWLVVPLSLEESIAYFREVAQGTVTDEEYLRSFVQSLMDFPALARRLGFDVIEKAGEPVVQRNTIVAKDRFKQINIGNGPALIKVLERQVTDRKVQVLFETPAKGLIRHPVTREILGVRAQSKGKPISVRANRAVILACGGYENNPEMKATFNFPGIRSFPLGSPYNTGDGFNMIAEVGAPLWHMNGLEFSSFCHLKAGQELGVAINSVLNDSILVNRSGRRFYPEGSYISHRKAGHPALEMDSTGNYTNSPAFLIFDETTRLKGPVGNRGGYAEAWNLYSWSQDNGAEVDKGWIIKASSLAELAAKADIDAAALQQTVARYNGFVAAGHDSEFDRDGPLVRIATPPYYCSEQALSVYVTFGGPRRNAKSQTLDTEKKPIPRLYTTGEFGSFWGYRYQWGGGVPESISTGFTAGTHAAGLKPWAA